MVEYNNRFGKEQSKRIYILIRSFPNLLLLSPHFPNNTSRQR